MEFTGKIIAILQPRGGVSKSGNEWKAQEYVIEDHGQYPRKMCFDVFGADKIEQFNIQMGEELSVSLPLFRRLRLPPRRTSWLVTPRTTCPSKSGGLHRVKNHPVRRTNSSHGIKKSISRG